MAKYINPLKAYSDKIDREIDLGVRQQGVEYLIKMNEEVNKIVKQNGLKTKDYKKMREEQQNGNKE